MPRDQLPLISRLIDIPFASTVCREAFGITTPPDVESINKHGGFDLTYPRLAIVDGERDPWRAATAHAVGRPGRPSTASEPFILIAGAVHHWDEYGVFPNETIPGVVPPPEVVDTQAVEAVFVQKWMAEWKLHCRAHDIC